MKHDLKIACIGNMNNNMFTLVRFLRDRGFDSHLLLLNEDDHFLPQADTFSSDYKEYTHQLNWFSKNNLVPGQWTEATPSSIKKDLKQYNFIIGCGYTPAFLEYAGLKLDIFIPYGSDLYELPFMKYWPAKKNTINNLYPLLQKKGIENAKNIFFDYTKEQEPVFSKFNLKGKRVYAFAPIFYTKEFNKFNVSKFYDQSILYKEIKKLRDENDLLIFQHSRQSWKNPEDEFSNKRNDILINAYASLKSKTNISSKLILLEYGVDVKASKELIKKHGIEEHVYWLPKSQRKELFVAISLCDIGVAELGMSFLMYGTVGEFITMDLPFIHNCEAKDYIGRYPSLYENNHADSVETLLSHFETFINDRSTYIQRAINTREWFMQHIINDPINKIEKIINDHINRPWYKRIIH